MKGENGQCGKALRFTHVVSNPDLTLRVNQTAICQTGMPSSHDKTDTFKENVDYVDLDEANVKCLFSTQLISVSVIYVKKKNDLQICPPVPCI